MALSTLPCIIPANPSQNRCCRINGDTEKEDKNDNRARAIPSYRKRQRGLRTLASETTTLEETTKIDTKEE